MINVFYRNRNTIGQFMVALIFLGTFGFLFTFDGFVSKSEATSCCCSGEAVVTSFTTDSSGDFGSEVPMDVEPTAGCGDSTNNPTEFNESKCTCNTVSCGNACSKADACGPNTQDGCPSPNSCYNKQQQSCEGLCEGTICKRQSQCGGNC